MRALLAIGLLMLGACGESKWRDLPTQTRNVRVVEVDPPKRLNVTVMDIENGTVYGPIYVSKRCSSYKRVPVGSEFPITMKVWEHKETGEIQVEPKVDELYQRFCG